jgi:hypothetical protein
LPIQVSDEVDTSRNVVDIHEQAFAAKGLGETIVKPTRRANRILASIVDENLTNHRFTAKSLYATTSESSLTEDPAAGFLPGREPAAARRMRSPFPLRKRSASLAPDRRT